jgi:hypothetical protein
VRVTPELDTLGSFFIAQPDSPDFMQTDPTVVFDGANYLVVWADEKRGTPNVFDPCFARVTPDGAVLDTGVFITTGPGASAMRPNVACDSVRSLVVWDASSSGIYGRFVNRSGQPEGDLIPIALGQTGGADLAYGRDNYLLVWFSGTYPALNLSTQIMNPDGELVGSPFPLTADANCHRWADVAFDGTNYLVVWQSGINNNPTAIYGQFIGADGSPVGDTFRICDPSGQQRWWPAMARAESNFLVTWAQGAVSDIYGNTDVGITGIAETHPSPEPVLRRTLVTGGRSLDGRPAFDVLGRRVNAARLAPGIYFTPSGNGAKCVMVR